MKLKQRNQKKKNKTKQNQAKKKKTMYFIFCHSHILYHKFMNQKKKAIISLFIWSE